MLRQQPVERAVSFWDAAKTTVEGRDESVLRLERKVQRVVAFSMAAVSAAAASVVGKDILIFSAWFILAGVLPAVFGRLIATFIAIASAFVILMGENGSGTAFRPLAVVIAAPFLLLAGILWSRAFAGVVGMLVLHGAKSVFAPRV